MKKPYHPRRELVDGGLITDHPLYYTFNNMWSRCTNDKTVEWVNYGGRGITVCDEWKDFRTFVSDMGVRPDGDYSIDRIDGDKGYCKENCRWATRQQQAENRRMFKNNKTGVAGVEFRKQHYLASIQIGNVRHNLGKHETIEEASAKREAFKVAYEADPVAALSFYVRGANLNNPAKERGVSRHVDGGYMLRVTENKVRKYLGYFATIAEAVAAREAYYAKTR